LLIEAPPSDAGADQVSEAEPLPGTANRFSGAAGAVFNTSGVELAE
jgi:hypothetical protein